MQHTDIDDDPASWRGCVPRHRWMSLLTGALLGLAVGGCGESSAPESAGARSEPPPPGVTAIVESVTDGDTIRIAGGRVVRLVQIDTPEVYGGAECGGPQASAALQSQLPAGTQVRLLADPATDPADRYGRLLRYVYVGDRNLNVWMVARGHAAPYMYQGEQGQFSDRLMRSARAAKAKRVGLWKSCPNAVLDARRGVSTGLASRAGRDGQGGASDAAAGARQLRSLPAAPPYPPDVDCADLSSPVRVTRDDPHRLDRDGDGIGCD